MVAEVLKWRLTLELRRHHGLVHHLGLGRSAFLILGSVVCAAVEVGWSFVLIWTAVLGRGDSQFLWQERQ